MAQYFSDLTATERHVLRNIELHVFSVRDLTVQKTLWNYKIDVVIDPDVLALKPCVENFVKDYLYGHLEEQIHHYMWATSRNAQGNDGTQPPPME